MICAMLMRLAPLLDFSLWGSDWGEYFYLADGLVAGGHHPAENLGWGKAYVDFPGLFDLAGSASLAMNVSMEATMSLVVPCTTAISCLLVACIVLRLGGGPWAALFSASLLAVAAPVVYSSSHPVPASIGSVLMLAVLLVFLVGDRWRRDEDVDAGRPVALHVLFLLLVLALVITHHMSTLFALFVIALAHPMRAILVRGVEPAREAWGAYAILTLLGVATAYWMVFTTTFREQVMVDLFGIPGWVPMAAAWAGVLALLGVSRLLSRGRTGPLDYSYSSPRELRLLVVAFLAIGTAILIMADLYGMPGTSIPTGPLFLLYIGPVMVVMAVVVGSAEVVMRSHGGHVVLAWTLALVGSFLFAVAFESRVLLSYRHFPYIMESLAVFAGFGLVHLRRMTLPGGRRWDRGVGVATALFVALLAVTAYPPKEVMGGFQEGTVQDEMEAVLWLQGGLPGPGAAPGAPDAGAVVADHRLSSMAYGIGGQMATWDTAGPVLHGPMDQGTLEALEAVETPQGKRPATAVMLSGDYRTGVALYQWEPALPLEGEAWDKFFGPPFVRLYDGGDVWVMGVAPPLHGNQEP